ncbi:MAG: class I SAM-dependent methyltransferase, partial [Nitrososphaeraceae archaeon]
KAALFCLTLFLTTLIVLASYFDQLDVHEILPVAIAALAAVTVIWTFVLKYKTEVIRFYSEQDSHITSLESSNEKLVKHVRESSYTALPDTSPDDFNKYAWLANQSIQSCVQLHAEKLWQAALWTHFTPLFERVRALHWEWFNDNDTLFSPEFVSFFKKAKWRQLFPPDRADQLRWIYETSQYDKCVMSPLHNEDLSNHLLNNISDAIHQYLRVDHSSKLNVADVGCGKGRLFQALIKRQLLDPNRVAEYVGIDYSTTMLVEARSLLRDQQPKVSIVNCDLRDLHDYYNRFNVVFSINSILPRDPDDLPRILREVSAVIKPTGLLIGILSSFDTILDLMKLDLNDLTKKYGHERGGEHKAKAEIDRLYHETRMLSEEEGLYADDGVNPQRHMKESEIPTLMKDADLEVLKIERFYYPWEICKLFDWGNHVGKPLAVYDWFVVAKKLG